MDRLQILNHHLFHKHGYDISDQVNELECIYDDILTDTVSSEEQI